VTDEDDGGPTGPAPEVPAIIPSCRECRRARAERLRRSARGSAATLGLPDLTLNRPVTRCTHIPTVWAPGYGPDGEPPEDSGWETHPDGPV
jgi:hypothetical protein